MFIPALGVFAGWIILMPNTVITLALCIDKITGTSGSSEYSLILGAGWLTLILALEVMGRLSDKLFVRSGTRSTLIWFGAIGTVLLGLAFASVDTLALSALIWCALQFPAAAIVSSSLALSVHKGESPRQGLASGLVGGAPVFSVLVGSLLVTAIHLEPRTMFLATCIAGAIAAVPVALTSKPSSHLVVGATQNEHHMDAKLKSPSPHSWRNFLIAAFLLSCSTSATNGYIIAYARNILNLDVTAATSLAGYMVLIAATASITIGILTGHFVRKARNVMVAYAVAAIVTGISIVLLLALHTSSTALVAALLFGLGFGAANGLEITIFKINHKDVSNAGRRLSTFTSVTTAPFVLVPAMAAALMHGGDQDGITELWIFGAVCAVVAALVALQTKSGEGSLACAEDSALTAS